MAEEKNVEWVKMKPAEVESLILDLHKHGNSPEKIGLILRDNHGIPKAKLLTGKRIVKTLKDNQAKIPSEKSKVEHKIKSLNSHIVKNKHDYTAKRSLTKKLWIVKKLEKQEKP